MKENNLKLISGEVITFTDEQIVALKKINEFILDKKKILTVLAGYAGTGKTTIMKKIIEKHGSKYIFCVSAPTNQATKNIGRITHQQYKTIQSLLGMRPDIDLADFNPNKPEFEIKTHPTISDYDIIIIDEASMINNKLVMKIIEVSKKYKTKIIFLGDPAQTPPVNEIISPIFKVKDEDIVWLKKIMRQKDGNPLLETYTDIRNNLKENAHTKWVTKLNKKNEGIIHIKDRHMYREFISKEFTKDNFTKDIYHTTILAWSNETVKTSNLLVRNFYHGDKFEKEQLIIEGEILKGYRNISKAKSYSNLITNSCLYRVVSVKKEKEIKGIKLITVNVIDEDNVSEEISIVNHLDNNSVINYLNKHRELVKEAFSNKKKWKDYYDFRAKHILMTNITTDENGRLLNDREIIAKDIDYGYGCTIHKATGTTYNNVFVLNNDIDLNPNIYEKNRLKYVALSRPRYVAYVLS